MGGLGLLRRLPVEGCGRCHTRMKQMSQIDTDKINTDPESIDTRDKINTVVGVLHRGIDLIPPW